MVMISKRRLLAAIFHPVTLRAGAINVLIALAILAILKWSSSKFTGLLFVISGYAAYYFLFVRAPTQIVALPDSDVAQRLLNWIPCVRQGGYAPSWWLMNRHIQTLWGAFRMQDQSRLGINREIAHGVYADGENCVLDWYRASPELAARGAAEWREGLVAGFSSGSAFLDKLASTQQQRRRHPGTAAAEGRIPHETPVIVVFHGLTSACGDPNILRLVELFNDRGWHAVIPIRRGCGDNPELVTRPKYYAYGGLEDTAVAMECIARRVPDHPLFAVGVSAGSNVMVNYLGTQGRCSLVLGAVSIANGFCWQRGTQALLEKSPVWDVLMSGLVKSTMYIPHASVISTIHTFEDGLSSHPQKNEQQQQQQQQQSVETPNNQKRKTSSPATSSPSQQQQQQQQTKPLRQAASMREIDDIVSKTLHGFDCLDEFYAEQSCVHRLHRVKVPVLFMNAIDDPIATFGTVPLQTLCCNENFVFALTPRGGHLGWGMGVFPFGSYAATKSFMDIFVMESLLAAMAEAKFRLREYGDFCGTASSLGVVAVTAAAAAASSSRISQGSTTQHGGGGMTSNRRSSTTVPSSSPPLATAKNIFGYDPALENTVGSAYVVFTPTMAVPRDAALFPTHTLKKT